VQPVARPLHVGPAPCPLRSHPRLTCKTPAIMSRRLERGKARSFSQLHQVSFSTPRMRAVSSTDRSAASRAREIRPPNVSSSAKVAPVMSFICGSFQRECRMMMCAEGTAFPRHTLCYRLWPSVLAEPGLHLVRMVGDIL